MAKKKEYIPQKNDEWDEEADKEHRRIIGEAERAISSKYKRWWDGENNRWKEGFGGH